MFTGDDTIQKIAIENELEFMAVFAGTSEAALDVREIISPEDFYSPAMGNCYRHLMNLHDMNGGFIAEDMLNYVRDNGGNEALQAVKAAVMGVITYSTQGAVSRARKIKQQSIWRQDLRIKKEGNYCRLYSAWQL